MTWQEMFGSGVSTGMTKKSQVRTDFGVVRGFMVLWNSVLLPDGGAEIFAETVRLATTTGGNAYRLRHH